MCLLAYAGIGAALGLGGPEICGAPAKSSEAWVSWLLIPGTILVCHRWRMRSRRARLQT
jgi:hypothetical protein